MVHSNTRMLLLKIHLIFSTSKTPHSVNYHISAFDGDLLNINWRRYLLKINSGSVENLRFFIERPQTANQGGTF